MEKNKIMENMNPGELLIIHHPLFVPTPLQSNMILPPFIQIPCA
jgi:hypothetical protein